MFETPWFAIDEVETSPAWNMGSLPFFRMVGHDHALVIPVTGDGRLIMVRQFRPARNGWTLEFPAGGVDPGEDAGAAARRELLEETGYLAEGWIELGRSGMANQRDATTCHVFAASGLRRVRAGGESGIETLAVTPAEILRHVRASEMDMLVSLGALFLAKAQLGDRFPDFW